ncbi:PLP-dependent aminotransferase family protein [Stappia indica]|uniref:aminotransferase-like domain-containing protein n=1 Tax=Stappia indica TaxID=538381 RepID=UPI00082F79AA|nr:PLP-dependent aminotransferase family protein [Stappia indica]
MRLRSPWQPRLAEGSGSPGERLAAALSQDILSGALEVGARLPAQRDLAWRLGIGLGTVTKAYALLERRGLLRSVRGSGSFVAATEARKGPLIDLSRNAPPSGVSERLLARTLAAVSRRLDADVFNAYPPVAGHARYRNEMARWFRRLGMEADPQCLLLAGGAQHALAVALSTLCGPGGTLLVEAQTYPGVLTLARHMGLRVLAVAMDGEGMLPDALDRALHDLQGQAVGIAVYLTPTMQNPTTGSMGRARREAIVAVCRARDAMLVEDDVYTLAPEAEFPPLASLAPERVVYINSLSKTLNPSLRVGGLVVPPPLVVRTEAALHASGLMISPLGCVVMEQWVLDGTAEAIGTAIREEAARRRALAGAILGPAMRDARHVGYHVWLPLGPQFGYGQAAALETAARALGILVTPPASTAAAPGTPADEASCGVRLCLGAPALDELETALRAIAGLVENLGAGAPPPVLA